MRWPDIPRQPPGSWDCTFYAASYLCALLGVGGKNGEEVKREASEHPRAMSLYPETFRGVSPAWKCWDSSWEERIATTYSFAPAFRGWMRSWTDLGHVGYALIHLSTRGTHAVILLDADAEGVTVADPIRGIVRDPWPFFESPVGDNRAGGMPSRVEAWYEVGASCPHNQACLHWLPEIEMWERRCVCGLNAYGMTLPDLDRVWRAKEAALTSGAPSARPRGGT